MEVLKCKGVDLYIVGPSESLFRPLKLSESTLLANGFFCLFGQFSIYNGDNELPTSIYRLFWPILSFFGSFCRFFWLENHLTRFLNFSLDFTIHLNIGLENVLRDGSLLKILW
jgi:hypothetical protein